ncbi:retrovirus-related pol polyprotein from transposon tnt 1-94, partial [Trifolium medium]|nr:retrovirus-related pol polyprotein from transposon tnt 1-94 [Trifolium medium]
MHDPWTGQLIGTGRKIGRLYELTELYVPLESNICAASTDSSIQLWHRRLAHSSIGKLRPVVSQGYLGSVINESFDCSACQTAKQPALSFNKSTSISASPFDLVHSDIWGPAPTPTMGGSR